MASSHSDAARLEQVVTEFFAKSLHIILESRSPYVSSRSFSGVSSPASSSSSSSSVRSRDKWFKLALRECPAALENIDICRQSNLGLMVIDVLLVKRKDDLDRLSFPPRKELVRHLSLKERYPLQVNTDQEELGCVGKSEKIIERWVVQYESPKSRDCSSGSRRSSSKNLQRVYKNLTILLRSLYMIMRLLPAFKIFQDLNSSGHLRTFALGHRVSSFVEPFTRTEEAEMQRYGFTPVDTSSGRMTVSVLYRASAWDASSEPSTPMSPQFIPDYVGSPLAEPLKRIPSFATMRGVQVSPSSSPFSRRHSWSYDQYKASSPSVSYSPSPTHPQSPASISNPSSRRFSPMSLPPHPSETSLALKKDIGFGENFHSPGFTPSSTPTPTPSPSPPIHLPATQLPKALSRVESAPVGIPRHMPADSPALNKENVPTSSPSRTNPTPCRAGGVTVPYDCGAMTGKSYPEKDDTVKYSGPMLSSNSLPRMSFARNSSKSLPDDYDEAELTCPFDVEEDDLIDPVSRPGSFDRKGHLCESTETGRPFPIRISQDAAVGALVQKLQEAQPLRQDLSTSVNSSPSMDPAKWGSTRECDQTPVTEAVHTGSSSVVSSGLVTSKTTSDALKELQGYKKLKNLLLSQGDRSKFLADYTSVPEPSA